ncbi:MAG: hypothetical protein ACOYM2_18915, partial [Rectinemataceae bacterium]
RTPATCTGRCGPQAGSRYGPRRLDELGHGTGIAQSAQARRHRGGGRLHGDGYLAYDDLAYVDARPAGWLNASPRSEYGFFRGIDPAGPEPSSVVGLSCFVIAPPYRRHGVAAAAGPW